MNKYSYILLSIVLFIVMFFISAGITEINKTYPTDELGLSINEYRMSRWRKPLEQNIDLCAFAEKRASEVVGDWSHNGFDNYDNQSYKMRGENLAKCFETDAEVLTAWIESTTHKHVLEGNFSSMCIARVYHDGCEYIVLEVAQ